MRLAGNHAGFMRILKHLHCKLQHNSLTRAPALTFCGKKNFSSPSQPRCHINKDLLCVSEEVEEALSSNKAVVALESTIITHGMPYPHNFSTALCVERRVRENGAVPATVAVLNGKICVGLSDTDLIWLAEKNNSLVKISRRDLSFVLSRGGSGGTTVSATMIAANLAGIPIFATGGIGGVHRGAETSFDVSADLTELGRTPVAVVSSGVKSILDIPKTLEYLETQGVFVASFSDNRKFPAFFTRDSGQLAPYNVATHMDAAQIIAAQQAVGLSSGMLFAVPIPSEISTAGEAIEAAIREAVTAAREKNITGKEVTPFVLGMVNELTGGESLVANIALVENNASVAGGIANCLAQLKAGVSPDKLVPPPHSSAFSLLQPTPSPALASAISSAEGARTSRTAPREQDYGEEVALSSDSDSDEDTKGRQPTGRPVVLGATIVDLTVRVCDPDLKTNGGTYAGKVSQSMGGVGRNLADCLSRLGLNPVFVSAAGKDASLVGCSHIDLSNVQRLSDHSTATYCPVLQSDGHLMFGVGDMNINTAFDVNKVSNIDELLASASIVVLDGNFSTETIQAVVEKCVQASVPVWFEPTDLKKARKPFETDAWKGISVASPNSAELESMYAALVTSLGLDASTVPPIDETTNLDDLLSACVEMCRHLITYIPLMVVTLGQHGLLLCHNQGQYATHLLPLLQQRADGTSDFHAVYYPTLRGESESDIASVSGAGDCLAATLLAAMLEGHPIDQCVQSAFRAADLSLTSSDAVPARISRQTVLVGVDSKVVSPEWRPRVLTA